jgi:hypothetical protein
VRISDTPKLRLILALSGTYLIASFVFSPIQINQNTYAKQLALREFGHIPEMVRVIECESNFRQYDKNGNPLIGFTGDIGIMQIAPQYWLEESKKLGHDIYTAEGNIAMGKVILERQGIDAWVCHRIVNKDIADLTNGRSQGS